MSEDDISMFRQVDWLKPADMEILELLALPRDRLKMTSGNISENIEYSREYTSDRCRLLTEKGLLVEGGNGFPFYRITELGVRVLNRDIEPEELIEEDEQTDLEEHLDPDDK